MKRFERYFSTFWTQEDGFTDAVYSHFNSTLWKPSEIFIREDINEWRKIESSTRDIIIESLLTYNAITQMIALDSIPKIIAGLDNSFVARQAVLSAMQARLTGPHTIITTRMIKEMNSTFLVDRIQENLQNRGNLLDIVENIDTILSSLQGWGLAYHSTGEEIEIDGFDSYDELTYSLWQACSMSAMVLQVAVTLPTTALFCQMERGIELPEMLKAIQILNRDISTISTYLCKLSSVKFDLLNKERQEEAKAWFNSFSIEVYSSVYNGTFSDLEVEDCSELKTLLEFNQYNINKILVRVGLETLYEQKDMPELISKYLGIETQLDRVSAFNKGVPWFKWRKK